MADHRPQPADRLKFKITNSKSQTNSKFKTETWNLEPGTRAGAPACGSRSLIVNSLQKPGFLAVIPIDPANRSIQQFHIPLIASPLMIRPGPPISGRAPGSGTGHNLMGSNACGPGRTKSPQGKLRDFCCSFVLCTFFARSALCEGHSLDGIGTMSIP